jgi:hypothetical protein
MKKRVALLVFSVGILTVATAFAATARVPHKKAKTTAERERRGARVASYLCEWVGPVGARDSSAGLSVSVIDPGTADAQVTVDAAEWGATYNVTAKPQAFNAIIDQSFDTDLAATKVFLSNALLTEARLTPSAPGSITLFGGEDGGRFNDCISQ